MCVWIVLFELEYVRIGFQQMCRWFDNVGLAIGRFLSPKYSATLNFSQKLNPECSEIIDNRCIDVLSDGWLAEDVDQ